MVCFKDIISKVPGGGGVQYFPGVQLLQWGVQLLNYMDTY